MEYINKIELKGNVGSNIKISDTSTGRVARFSVATNYLYSGKEKGAASETTWHNIVAWEGKCIDNLDTIMAGEPIYVCGRMKCSKFTGNDGNEKQVYEVVANKILRGEDLDKS